MIGFNSTSFYTTGYPSKVPITNFQQCQLYLPFVSEEQRPYGTSLNVHVLPDNLNFGSFSKIAWKTQNQSSPASTALGRITGHCQDLTIDKQISSYPAGFQQLFCKQWDIGWDQIYYGRISILWVQYVTHSSTLLAEICFTLKWWRYCGNIFSTVGRYRTQPFIQGQNQFKKQKC